MKFNKISFLFCGLVLISVVTIGLMLPSVNATAEATNNIPYTYPIQRGTDEWCQLKTLEDKLAACQIPEDVLSQMTTDALIETVKNYPLAINIYAYSTIDRGYEVVKSQFNGLAELDRRLATEPIATKESLSVATAVSSIDADGDDELGLCFLNTLNRLVELETEDEMAATSRYIETYVMTPNGTQVAAHKGIEWYEHDIGTNGSVNESESRIFDAYVEDSYPSVIKEEWIDPSYNCHSYAFYSTSSSNDYWIDDPSAYVLDGSHPASSYYYVGGKVLYGTPGNSPEHSGIITGVSDNHLTYVTSKWGTNGVYKHLYYDCPYSTSQLGKYHE